MAGSAPSGTTTVHPEHGPDIRVVEKPRTSGPIDFELTSMVRRIFLTPASGVRCVLFCTVPGEDLGDAAKEVAEALAAQSGQRVALIEHTSRPHGQQRMRIPDLFTSFAFVIVTADVTSIDDLISIAQEVDGVIVGVTKDHTRIDIAHGLVTTLRKARANLLGAIYFSE